MTDANRDVPMPMPNVWARWPDGLRRAWPELWCGLSPEIRRTQPLMKVSRLFEIYEYVLKGADPTGVVSTGHDIRQLEGELGITSQLRRRVGLPDPPDGEG
jgi:hypothetical protein